MAKLIASPIGLAKIKQKRKEKGWNLNDLRWLESASEALGVAPGEGKFATGVSYGTWKRFLSGKYQINDRAFKAYCQVLGVEWQEVIAANISINGTSSYQDWGEAIDVSLFFGRTEELVTLERWIVNDKCRTILLLGMGGIGKTALAIKSARILQDKFEFVLWRSLRNAPTVEEFLAETIQFISNKQEAELPESLAGKISLLLEYLRRSSCLLILDNAESILEGDRAEASSQYRQGYAGYGQLFEAIGETKHQSCLLITSREKPKEIATLEGDSLAVRCLLIKGLQPAQTRELLATKGKFVGTETAWQVVIDRYGGNPLALKIVASYIRDFFDGNIDEFLAILQEGLFIFDDIRLLLEQQFQRLNDLEREIMYWLAIDRQPVSLSELQNNFIDKIAFVKLVEALTNLKNRSLIETNKNKFTQQPVLMEYTINELINNIREEIVKDKIELFNTHAIVKARATEYIRESQSFLILQPLVTELISVFGSSVAIEVKLREIIASWQIKPRPGYLCGNIINLLRQLDIDLTGYDFSGLTVWQANLQALKLHRVNFSNCDLSHSIFTETLGNVLSAALSPQGDLFATSDNGDKIRIRDKQTGKLLSICQGHTNWIRCIAFNPDGKTIVSGASDLEIRLWDSYTGQCRQTFCGHKDEIYSVACSSDNRTIASGSGDRTIKLWDIKTGRCLKTLDGHRDWVRSVAFSLDGKLLASGSSDCTIKLWDIKTGRCLKTLDGHRDWVRSVAFSSDGKLLASGSSDCTIKLWDIKTGKCCQSYTGHSSGVYAIAFSPARSILASGSGDTTIRLWDTTTNKCLKTLYGHTNQIISVDFGSDSNTIICASLDRTVKLWDINTGKCLRNIQGYADWAFPVTFAIQKVGTNARKEILATNCSDYTIKLWDTKTGKCDRTLYGHQDHIWSLAFSPDGNLLASCGADRHIRLWNAIEGACCQVLSGHEDWVYSVTFHPNGNLLASSSGDGTVRVWDIDSGYDRRVIKAPQVWSTAISKNGLLATGSRNCSLNIWNIETGKQLQICSTENCQGVYSVAFSPDSQTLFSGSGDNLIRCWNLPTGKCLRVLSGHRGFVFAVAVSPDGKTLASGSCDRTIKLWNIATGECLHTLNGHDDKVCAVAFSPDGRVVASGSQDRSAKLWEIETGKCLKVLRATRLYEAMNITGVRGLTPAEVATLKSLGADCS